LIGEGLEDTPQRQGLGALQQFLRRGRLQIVAGADVGPQQRGDFGKPDFSRGAQCSAKLDPIVPARSYTYRAPSGARHLAGDRVARKTGGRLKELQ
jgi:hypothetical protein